jgi:hypothetical protein
VFCRVYDERTCLQSGSVPAAGCCRRRHPWAGLGAPPHPQTAFCWILMLAQPHLSGDNWVAAPDAPQQKVTAMNEQRGQRLHKSTQVCRQSSGRYCA